MKNKNILSIFAFLLFSLSPLLGQRVMFFVHGFGANNSAWLPVTRAINNGRTGFIVRPAITIPESYTEGVGVAVNTLDAAGDNLKLNFQRDLAPYGGINSARAQDAILIAHSQGGLVSRWATDISALGGLSKENAICSGGLVTFGTPNGGAKLAESRANGVLDAFLNSGCNDFGGGLIAEAWPSINIPYQGLLSVFGVSVINTLESTKSALCNTLFSQEPSNQPRTTEFLSQKLLGSILNSDGTKSIIEDKILNDYQPNAPKLAQLVGTSPTTTVKRLAFYGDEIKSEAFIRTMRYIITPSQASDPFEATDDKEDALVTSFNNMRVDLKNSAQNFDLFAVLTGCMGFTSDWTCWVFHPERKYLTARDACNKAVLWMDNSNASWLNLMGAAQSTTIQSTQCMCDVGGSGYVVQRACTRREVTRGCEEEIVTRVILGATEDNDGVVTKSSALALPGKIQISESDARMPGSQHMQMRNDPNTKDKLNNLFNGNYDPFFRTQ